MFGFLDGDQLEAVAKVVSNACLPRDIEPNSTVQTAKRSFVFGHLSSFGIQRRRRDIKIEA
jgi:hypothetical protein